MHFYLHHACYMPCPFHLHLITLTILSEE
jgi:hypothetical protein